MNVRVAKNGCRLAYMHRLGGVLSCLLIDLLSLLPLLLNGIDGKDSLSIILQQVLYFCATFLSYMHFLFCSFPFFFFISSLLLMAIAPRARSVRCLVSF